MSAAAGRNRCIELLVEKGANPAAKSFNQETYEAIGLKRDREGDLNAQVLGQYVEWVPSS